MDEGMVSCQQFRVRPGRRMVQLGNILVVPSPSPFSALGLNRKDPLVGRASSPLGLLKQAADQAAKRGFLDRLSFFVEIRAGPEWEAGKTA
jgi:hypothetical protein